MSDKEKNWKEKWKERWNALSPAQKAVRIATIGAIVGITAKDSVDIIKNKKMPLYRHFLVPAVGLAGIGASDLMGKKSNLEKIAGAIAHLKDAFTEPAGRMAASHVREIASLGALAVPSVYNATHKKKMSEGTQAALEVGGLGALAAPYAYKLIKGH